MPRKDLHKDPFTKETVTKLEIFEAYFKEWLPVFIYTGHKLVNVCDFFAGTGTDINGVSGSPLRLLDVIGQYRKDIFQKDIKIHLLLNEFDEKKFVSLQKCVNEKIKKLNFGRRLEVNFQNKDFSVLFKEELPKLRDQVNLFFLDQNGIKQVTDDTFREIESCLTTDFMFFISSSYFNRFAEEESFKSFFPDIAAYLKTSSYTDCHRAIVEYFRSRLPADSKTKLYPFSFRKNQNIHGLIFGTKHPLGIIKFLDIAWKKNSINGEANFDIDQDNNLQFDFIKPKITKLEKFEQDLKNFILSKKGKKLINKDIFDFTLERGHIPKHAVKVIQALRRDRRIYFTGISPKIAYDYCYKSGKISVVEFQIL